MEAVLLTAAIVLLVVAGFVWTLVDPSWARQVRWTVAAPALGFAATPHALGVPLDLREVTLGSVQVRNDLFELEVLDRRAGGRSLTYVSEAVPGPDVLAMLDEWSALRTPMVLHVDGAGVASLTGPVATITGLRPAVLQPHPVRHVMQEKTEGP
jgi:hypothetical protein